MILENYENLSTYMYLDMKSKFHKLLNNEVTGYSRLTCLIDNHI